VGSINEESQECFKAMDVIWMEDGPFPKFNNGLRDVGSHHAKNTHTHKKRVSRQKEIDMHQPGNRWQYGERGNKKECKHV
jgi:hypothetical protein